MLMDSVVIIGIIFIAFYLIYKFKKPKRKARDFRNIIIYAADFLAANPTELTVVFNDVSYLELLAFVRNNQSLIMNFKQIDATAITFDVPIQNRAYMVIGRKFLSDELMLTAKAL